MEDGEKDDVVAMPSRYFLRYYLEGHGSREREEQERGARERERERSDLVLLLCHQTAFFHLSTHFLAFSLNF